MNCFLIRERPESICAKLSLVGINGLLCFVVDGEDGIFPALGAALLLGGNRHIVLVAQPFYSLFQLVHRKTAHLHPASARNGAAEKVQVQLGSGGASIFTIQLVEVPHLVKDEVIRVALLDAVVLPNGFFLARLVQILTSSNQHTDPLCRIRPGKPLLLSLGVGAQLDAAGIVFQETVAAIQESPALATDAVFLFEELGPFFGGVVFLKISRNPLFALGKAAAAGQGQRNVLTGKRKSGDFFGLRSSVDLFDLLRFTGEETQLLMSSAIRISSACALQVFIRPTHFIGSRAFSSSVAPASFAS